MAANSMLSTTLDAMTPKTAMGRRINPSAPPPPPRFLDTGEPNSAYGDWLRTWAAPDPAPATTTPIVSPQTPSPTPGQPTPSPLPSIPALPSIYSGQAPEYYTQQINALLPQLDSLKNTLNSWDKMGHASTDDKGKLQAQVDILQGQLTDLQAAKLKAQQGFAANEAQQQELASLPALESFLNTNLTDQTKFAVSQINPLIEERLNALGILDSGALAAQESLSMERLLKSQQGRVGDFMTSALADASLGLSRSQYDQTIQGLLGATQRGFAQQDVASEREFALEMQREAIQAQNAAQMPFWQQLLLTTLGGASGGIGAYLGNKIGGASRRK